MSNKGVRTCIVGSTGMLTIAMAIAASTAPTQGAQVRSAPAQTAALPSQHGTAVLRGRVVAAETGRPLRRARITLSSSDLGAEGRRTASTNPDGVYEFKELRAARYRISVSRGGYLPLEYGQRRPGEQGRPVQVGDAEVLERIDFALPRMSVITGRVSDEVGEPIEGVSVYAMRMLYFEGRRRLVPVSSSPVTTDDAGEYRILRLAPGAYTVMASTKETWTVTEKGRETVFGYIPTYFPGVIKGTDARSVTLTVGQEAGATDLSVIPGRAVKVSGQALDSQGRPFAHVSIGEEIRGMGFASFRAGPDVSVAADGTFTALNVPPGEYTVTASRLSSDPSGPEVALTTINVEGVDIDNLTLIGSSGGSANGRVVTEDGDVGPKMSGIRVAVLEQLRSQPNPALLGAFGNFGSAQVKDDGTFSIAHIFGRSRFQVMLPDGWMLKSVMRGRRNITDTWIDVKSGEDLGEIEVIITNHVTSVRGQLTDDRNRPLGDATVLLFPNDADKWFETSRTIRSTRPDQQGTWQIKGLPAGDYLAVALDYIEDGAWNDPDYLESLRRDARRITVSPGGSHNIALKLAVPKQ